MTPAARRALARVLGALLPWRLIGRFMDDQFEAQRQQGRGNNALLQIAITPLRDCPNVRMI